MILYFYKIFALQSFYIYEFRNKLINFAVQIFKKQIMKKIFQPILFLSLVLITGFFSSCEKDGVSSIQISKTTLSLNVGHIDTISATVNFVGDLTKIPATWTVADTNIVSIVTELKGAAKVANSESSIEKMLVIKAKKLGTTKVTLAVDGKTIDCDVTVMNSNITLQINKTTLSVNVGLVDTIVASINLSGQLSNIPTNWIVADTSIVSIVAELKGATSVTGSESTIEKLLIIKAKKSGNTKITLTVDGKTIDCDVTVIMRKFTFTKIIANNYGDYYDIETNNFEMILYENTMSLNNDKKLVGDGNFIQLEFSLPLMQNSIAVGDFSISDEKSFGVQYTFFPGDIYQTSDNTYFLGSFVANTKNNVRTFSLVIGGTYKVTTTDNGYKIDGELLLEGDEVIQFEYTGNPIVTDQRDAAEIKPTLTHGLLHYYGDYYKTTKSNNLSVYLASASLNFTNTATKGDILALEVNVPLTVTDSLPNGTYNFVNFPQNMTALPISDFVPFTLVPPFYDADSNELGSWFYGEEKTKKLKTGSINVTKTGVKSYKIIYEFYDRFGAKISGTFNGNLEYTDKTKTASGVKMAKVPVRTKYRTISPTTKINEFAKKQKQRVSYF